MDIATLVVVGLVIVVALTFDFTNGFHDTANAMATSIATGALKPKNGSYRCRYVKSYWCIPFYRGCKHHFWWSY